jgi:hypothetical protein
VFSGATGAILRCGTDVDGTVHHEAEADEVLRRTSVDGCTALEIENAHIDGLPAGVVAFELGVDAGDRSFRAIMSGLPVGVEQVWNGFVASIDVEPQTTRGRSEHTRQP